MSYFIPRARGIIGFEKGSLEEMNFPVEVSTTIVLAPSDLFGIAGENKRRSVVPPSNKNTIFWDADAGRMWVESDNFLPPLIYSKEIGELSLSFNGNVITAKKRYQTLKRLKNDLSGLEHQLTSYLTLFLGTFVRVESITCNIEPNTTFRYQLLRTDSQTGISREEGRLQKIDEAVNLMSVSNASTERFVLACIYFQQARRLVASYESDIPSQNFAEMFVNLAKCLELLFSNTRDALREKCRRLGFTNEEIESKIIPILVIRNELDIAHSAGRRISNENTQVIRDYGYVSLDNVRTILITISKKLSSSENVLEPLSDKPNKEVEELCMKLQNYLKQPNLQVK